MLLRLPSWSLVRASTALMCAAAAPSTSSLSLRLVAHLSRRIEHHDDHQRPFVTLSYAQSLDGSMSGPLGARGPRLILSGDESMVLTHHLRAAHDAMLIGIGTLLSDDPILTVRFCEGETPLAIILDGALRTPPSCRLLGTLADRQLVVATLSSTVASAEGAARARELSDRGVHVIASQADALGRVDIAELLSLLRTRFGVCSIMVEGGPTTIGTFIRRGLVDHYVLTVAPTFAHGLSPAAASVHAGGGGLCDGDSDAGSTEPLRPRPLMSNVQSFVVGEDVIVSGEALVAVSKAGAQPRKGYSGAKT